MPQSYNKAALRHYQDAELLASRAAFDGAGHLIGFAAECAVKHSVVALRPTATAPHLHFPQLAENAKKLLQGRTKHAMLTLLCQRDFLKGWSIDTRYADDGTIAEEQFTLWRSHASRAIGAANLRSKKT